MQQTELFLLIQYNFLNLLSIAPVKVLTFLPGN